MSFLRDKRGEAYYYCRQHYLPWAKDPCTYNRFVLGRWDSEIWDEICSLLMDEA